MRDWLKLALRRDIRRRGLKVGLIVGTILTIINQGDFILSGVITLGLLGKVTLTFCVPYCVSTYAAVDAIRRNQTR